MCDTGLGDCDGMTSNGCEIDLTASAQNCGACGNACGFARATALCVASVCRMGACVAGFADCNAIAADGCEADLQGDSANCGACGRACALSNASATCAVGGCRIAMCLAGSANCDGVTGNGCETALSTTSDCGACGRACGFANAAATCAGALCRMGACDAGFADCDGVATNGCEARMNTTANCGSCGRSCALSNAMAACMGGACAVAGCAAGHADCDGAATNGCETATTTTANCGSCRAMCAFPNAAASCAGGGCVLGACAAGYADCDGNLANGCEVNTQSNALHCAGCGRACPAMGGSAACVSGLCRTSSCMTGRGDCDGVESNGCETETATATAHCGACGNACVYAHAAATCASGGCRMGACSAGFADCNRVAADGCETDLATTANCSRCGGACSFANAAATCAGGACALGACLAGYGDCNALAADGCETALASNSAHCSRCGNPCMVANGTASCTGGNCAFVSCNPGYGDCDGSTANGCEAALNTAVNCGRCAAACAAAHATSSCATGGCQVTACEAGYANCNGLVSDGCETSLRDVTNCGACRRACASTEACCNGVCCALSCAFCG